MSDGPEELTLYRDKKKSFILKMTLTVNQSKTARKNNLENYEIENRRRKIKVVRKVIRTDQQYIFPHPYSV